MDAKLVALVEAVTARLARDGDGGDVGGDELTAAVRTGSATVGEACVEFETLQEEANAPARMAQAELVLGTALEIVQEVRPTFDDFYAVLDADQKAALDKMAYRHRR